MWNKFFGLMKLVYDYGEDTKKNSSKIKEMEAEIHEISDNITHMAYDIERLRDEMRYFRNSESSEREKMALRLENTLLKMRQLPAPKSDETE